MKRKPTTAEYKRGRENGLSNDVVYRRFKRGWDVEIALTKPANKQSKPHVGRELAIYKGEELPAMGTLDEVAEELNVDRKTIMFYSTPTYKRRLASRNVKSARELVWLDDDKD